MPAYRPLRTARCVAVAVAVNAHVKDDAHVDVKLAERP
jgi:hypothetical protein